MFCEACPLYIHDSFDRIHFFKSCSLFLYNGSNVTSCRINVFINSNFRYETLAFFYPYNITWKHLQQSAHYIDRGDEMATLQPLMSKQDVAKKIVRMKMICKEKIHS